MLDPAEEARAQVARTVRAAIVVRARDVVGARRDDRLRTGRFDAQDQSVGIVSCVGNRAGACHAGDQIVRTRDVGNLACARIIRNGLPKESTAKCNLVVKPSRERPSASGPVFWAP